MWVMMPFGVRNGSPTYQKVVTKVFCEYINIFMKIFLNDFTIFNDILIDLKNLENVLSSVESLVLA